MQLEFKFEKNKFQSKKSKELKRTSSNLSWNPTRAKFCQLIASLSVILPQFYVIKLEYLKSSFNAKKKDVNTDKSFFVSFEFNFFLSSAQVYF